jgi:hypothetical protein
MSQLATNSFLFLFCRFFFVWAFTLIGVAFVHFVVVAIVLIIRVIAVLL